MWFDIFPLEPPRDSARLQHGSPQPPLVTGPQPVNAERFTSSPRCPAQAGCGRDPCRVRQTVKVSTGRPRTPLPTATHPELHLHRSVLSPS